MGWTDSDTVKKHLLSLDQNNTSFLDVTVRINDVGIAVLPHRGLVSLSEKVKVVMQLAPLCQSGVTLMGETWKQLNYSKLVPCEIVLASDSGLQTVYMLDSDYCFKADDGKVRRIAGGLIPDGGSVEAWYQRYSQLTKSIDYNINYSTGEITVIPGGSLSADMNIVVDYEISAASSVDQLMSEALEEAEDKILTRLKPEYDISSTDQGLITGATELTLAILCRSLAIYALIDGATAAENRSRGWRNLADRYETLAWQTLQPFLQSPMVTGGARQTNSNWEWQ